MFVSGWDVSTSWLSGETLAKVVSRLASFERTYSVNTFEIPESTCAKRALSIDRYVRACDS